MSCFWTVIIVMLIIIAAAFIYCKVTGKTIYIQGGHEVKHNGKTLHVQNFRLLKEKLREKFPDLDTEEMHGLANKIIGNLISYMPKRLGYHDQAKWLDKRIKKYIKIL